MPVITVIGVTETFSGVVWAADAVLVTGATGAQGGAVVDALLAAGRPVRALVRNPDSAAARRLAERGVELRQGSFEDSEAVAAAVRGANGVFSMQLPPRPDAPDSEQRAARILVDSAVAAGVRAFVHTSVARADEHEQFIGWHEGRWWPLYWTSKAAANEAVRSSALTSWTILKPAFMMDNFVVPKANSMFPGLAAGEIVTAMRPETRLDLIAASDIGRVAAAALCAPERFDRQEIDLAAESSTMSEVAAAIAGVTNSPVSARHLEPHQAVAAGARQGVVESQVWASVEGYKVDLDRAARRGFDLRSFADWALEHESRFVVGDH